MKKRFRKSRATGHRELVITPGKGEALNPKQSAWLKGSPHRTFLPFDFSYGRNAQDVALYYDVNGLVSLKTYVRKNRFDESGLARLYVDIALALIWCNKSNNRYFSMVFDMDSVFVDADGHLSFVFVPFDGMSFRVENSPLMLLRQLGDAKRLKLEGQNANVLTKRLSEYVLNENEVFSLNNFRSFIRSECWIDVDPDGRVKRVPGSSVDSGIETGGFDELPSNGSAREITGPGGYTPGYGGGTGPDGTGGGIATPTGMGYRGLVGAPDSPYALVRLSNGERFPLAADNTLFVGRGSDCQIRILGNPRIGRHHLALRCTGEGLVLQDLGSANGTTVAGQQLDPSYAVLVPYGMGFCLGGEECAVQKN